MMNVGWNSGIFTSRNNRALCNKNIEAFIQKLRAFDTESNGPPKNLIAFWPFQSVYADPKKLTSKILVLSNNLSESKLIFNPVGNRSNQKIQIPIG